MKIVITGGNGQLGKDCQQVMSSRHKVYSFGSSELNITRQEQVRPYLTKDPP